MKAVAESHKMTATSQSNTENTVKELKIQNQTPLLVYFPIRQEL